MPKPLECTCEFPELHIRNGRLHAISCRAYRWQPEIGDNPSPSSPPAESKPAPAIEDRGTAAWIFEGGGFASFCPFPAYARRHEISVPIGWSMVPHESGVLIANRFRIKLSAWTVLDFALRGSDGFRVRNTWTPGED